MPHSINRRFFPNPPTVWLASSGLVPPGVTFSRTGVGLYLTGAAFATSTYASAATDVPRFERLPSGSTGWLGEGQATNLVLNSYDLRIATNWVDVNAITNTLDQVGLTGSSNTATLVNDASATQRAGIITTGMTIPTAASTFYMRTFTLKDTNQTRFPEIDGYFTPGNHEVWLNYNTQTGATLDLGAPASSISPTFYARDRGLWWEVGFHGVKMSADTSATFNQFPCRGGAPIGTFTPTATGSIIVGGMDFVMDSRVLTSPIQTNGAAGTRNAEVATATTGLPPAYGFSVAFRARTAAGLTGNQYLWSVDDGTTSNFAQIRRTSAGVITLDVTTGGVSQASMTAGTIADDTEFNVAASISPNGMNICTGTTLGTRDTSCTMPTGLTTQRFMSDQANINQWNGHILMAKTGPVWLYGTNDAGLLALCA